MHCPKTVLALLFLIILVEFNLVNAFYSDCSLLLVAWVCNTECVWSLSYLISCLCYVMNEHLCNLVQLNHIGFVCLHKLRAIDTKHFESHNHSRSDPL